MSGREENLSGMLPVEMEGAEGVFIRAARLEDAEDMALIDELCSTIPWMKESFEREIEENKIALYLVAATDEEVVGYMGLWRVADEGHITNVAVAPKFRRMRIASALMETMFDVCGAEGVMDYTLEVRVSNEPAQELYKKHGFKGVGVRKDYYFDDHEDALIMWRMTSGREHVL